MTDRSAFISAIKEQPEDDTARLVFADFLDEQGEAIRAELIRIGCGVHVAEEECRGQEMGASLHRACELRRRQSELLAREWELFPFMRLRSEVDWLRSNRPIQGGCCNRFGDQMACECRSDAAVIVWRRGFVEEVTCTWSDCRDWLDKVLGEHPVRQVMLTTMPEARTTRAGRHKSGQHRIRLEGRKWHDCSEVASKIGTIADWSIASNNPQHLSALLYVEWPGIRFTLP